MRPGDYLALAFSIALFMIVVLLARIS
jgi:hypothetical protein